MSARRPRLLVPLLMVSALAVAGCTDDRPEAVRLCAALDDGVVPGNAIEEMDGYGTHPTAALDRAVGAIRTNCPQHAMTVFIYQVMRNGPPRVTSRPGSTPPEPG